MKIGIGICTREFHVLAHNDKLLIHTGERR